MVKRRRTRRRNKKVGGGPMIWRLNDEPLKGLSVGKHVTLFGNIPTKIIEINHSSKKNIGQVVYEKLSTTRRRSSTSPTKRRSPTRRRKSTDVKYATPELQKKRDLAYALPDDWYAGDDWKKHIERGNIARNRRNLRERRAEWHK